MPNSKLDFQNHLAQLGFDFSGNPPAILQRLRGRMGEERFARYMGIVNTVRDGDEYNRIYDFMQDLVEANLLRSMSPDVTLEASYRLYERAYAHLRPGTRVLELGCWTGGLVSFIAANHPGCAVVGVDRAQRMIELDRSHYAYPNLSFETWDYRQPPPPGLEPAGLLLCSLGININTPPGQYKELDPTAVRKAAAYEQERAELVGYFENWRKAARDGARLLAVLRVGYFPRFLAVVDAAIDAGWKVVAEELESILAPANNDNLPLMSFVASAGQRMEEELALSYWMRLMQNTHHLVSLAEAVAIGVYRALGPKTVLGTRDSVNPEGFAVHEEIGTCGSFGYVYTQDSRPSHRLDLLTLPAIEQRRRATASIPSTAGGGSTVHNA